MNRHSALLLTVFAVAGLGGCGDSSPRDASQRRPETDPAADRAAAERAVHQWVDDDNCTTMSEKFAAEGFASAAEGRADCERHEDRGLRAGEYEITRTTMVSKDQARAELRLNEGGTRTYGLVREDGHWRIDTFAERFNGKVGDTFTLKDSYEQNGTPVTVDVRVTLLAVRKPSPSSQIPTRCPESAGFVRASGREPQPVQLQPEHRRLQLVGDDGARYPSNGAAFEPSLGNGGVDLSQGEVVTGYLAGFMVPKKAKLREIWLNVASGRAARVEPATTLSEHAVAETERLLGGRRAPALHSPSTGGRLAWARSAALREKQRLVSRAAGSVACVDAGAEADADGVARRSMHRREQRRLTVGRAAPGAGGATRDDETQR